ncbi:TonB-dependent receptor plug domain-containing protein [Carboxylicivirga sp. A043]|uniref:TonB-dependent receptor plug domain-containing protein n=1 Tax=Carboxylicivirga litoralis TaxID=2816963 RepID=UPI0021CB000C|nr:TonB-dependent receptor plug domain-containing protein [Carboxylicivirga sp. A043]MCU4156854.1 TonB-dependent receptor plug domain-containing protein [Carboxylicivirga sp. A043]
MKKRLLMTVAVMVLTLVSYAQESYKVDVEGLTLEQIKGYTQDDLLQFSFEDLIRLVEKFKLSSIDELYAMLLNPTQSTASKMEEDVYNAPLATSVLTAQQLEQSGARSIPEALRLMPGIIVREKTNGNYDVHIRGNDYVPPGSDITSTVNSTTLVMIDNRPVYNNFLGATFWENLPVALNDLEKIEVIYGPSSALYGPNAVSGVIHLITKNTDAEGIKSHFDVQGGDHNSQILYGDVSYKKGNWGLRLSANYQNADRFQNTYYIPQMDTYALGDEVGQINAGIDTTYNASAFDSDYWNAKQQGAVNLFVEYQPSDKLGLNYTGSYQSSSVQTAYMDIGSVLTTRVSSSFSNNFNLRAGNFDANASATFGRLNAIEGLPGYEYDYMEINGQLAYNLKYKNLVIRPGLESNYAYYSDEDYVDVSANQGLLNGNATLGSLQGSLRLDYTAFNKLRLVGALMQGYFFELDKNYTSYQFSSSYKFGESTLLRAVASKANSSPFILNTYMNRQIESAAAMGQTGSMTMLNLGNKDLNPVEMTMLEMGLRQKIGKKLQADLSVFYNQSNNYSQLVNETNQTMQAPGEGEGEPTEGAPDVMNTTITETVQNTALESEQIGATLSLKYVMNEKFNASLFATYQQTALNQFDASNGVIYEGLTGEPLNRAATGEESGYISIDHDYTPTVYGGASFNYQPNRKLNINASLYAYGKQESFYSFGPDYVKVEIDPKISANMKVSYELTDWMNVYLNARNITNQSSQEFMFSDETGSSYLMGLNLKF